jgi:hypothetical protein
LKIHESIRNKFLIPFRLVPAEGLSPEKLAFSVTIGIICGIFPVLGTTTILSLLLTGLFRQNLLVVQSVQWTMALFQIILIIPFMQFGSFLLDQQQLQINIEQVKLAFHPGMIAGIKTIGIFHLYGILTWSLLLFPLAVASYFICLNIFKRRK